MKKNMTKVMAMGMVLTMLAGTTAFASGTAAEATKGVDTTTVFAFGLQSRLRLHSWAKAARLFL